MDTGEKDEQQGRKDPDSTSGKNDIVSAEGVNGYTGENDDENPEDVFSDEGLDQPGGTSGAESGTAGLARDDD